MASAAPGFYGKAPAFGDFVTRRVPAGFLATWDHFLAGMVQASRARLGADWLAAWNEAPVWHFALGPGLAGPQPWFGVLIPSVDRVGRQFPFSILGAAAASGMEHAAWLGRVETLALGALEDGFDASLLDAALQTLGAPASPVAGAFADLADGQSIWTCRNAPRHRATARHFAGLPAPSDSVQLVAETG